MHWSLRGDSKWSLPVTHEQVSIRFDWHRLCCGNRALHSRILDKRIAHVQIERRTRRQNGYIKRNLGKNDMMFELYDRNCRAAEGADLILIEPCSHRTDLQFNSIQLNITSPCIGIALHKAMRSMCWL